jgi:hypothetical protein|nr:MAG TPA: hypothetical protein [Caudoviricetes sp.]
MIDIPSLYFVGMSLSVAFVVGAIALAEALVISKLANKVNEVDDNSKPTHNNKKGGDNGGNKSGRS